MSSLGVQGQEWTIYKQDTLLIYDRKEVSEVSVRIVDCDGRGLLKLLWEIVPPRVDVRRQLEDGSVVEIPNMIRLMEQLQSLAHDT